MNIVFAYIYWIVVILIDKGNISVSIIDNSSPKTLEVREHEYI